MENTTSAPSSSQNLPEMMTSTSGTLRLASHDSDPPVLRAPNGGDQNVVVALANSTCFLPVPSCAGPSSSQELAPEYESTCQIDNPVQQVVGRNDGPDKANSNDNRASVDLKCEPNCDEAEYIPPIPFIQYNFRPIYPYAVDANSNNYYDDDDRPPRRNDVYFETILPENVELSQDELVIEVTPNEPSPSNESTPRSATQRSLKSSSDTRKKNKRNGKMLYTFEEYFYAEFTNKKSHQQTEGLECDEMNQENGKKGSKAKYRKKGFPKKPDLDANDITAEETKKPFVDNRGSDSICLVPCRKCPNWLKPASVGLHIWDHMWNDLCVPQGDDSFNLCFHCHRNFATRHHLRDHYMMINRFGKYLCMICLRGFETDDQRMLHMCTNHVRHSMPYFCPICPYRCSTSMQFAHHYECTHSLPICHLCLEVFPSAECMLPTSLLTGMDRKQEGYHLNVEMEFHLEMHVANKTLICDKCTLSFASATDLIVHQKSAHTNVKLNMIRLPPSVDEFKKQSFQFTTVEGLDRVAMYDSEEHLKGMLRDLVPDVSLPAIYKQAAKYTHKPVPMRSKNGYKLNSPDMLSSSSQESLASAVQPDQPEEDSSSGTEIEGNVEINKNNRNEADNLDLYRPGPSGLNNRVHKDPNQANPVARDNLGDNEEGDEHDEEIDPFKVVCQKLLLDNESVAKFCNNDQAPANGNRLLIGSMCGECFSDVSQPWPNSGHTSHFASSLMRCLESNCQYETACYEAFDCHQHEHEEHDGVAQPRVVTDPVWAMTREPDEHLLVCFNCMRYFERYEDMVRHVIYRKHHAFAHSFEEEIREHEIRAQEEAHAANVAAQAQARVAEQERREAAHRVERAAQQRQFDEAAFEEDANEMEEQDSQDEIEPEEDSRSSSVSSRGHNSHYRSNRNS